MPEPRAGAVGRATGRSTVVVKPARKPPCGENVLTYRSWHRCHCVGSPYPNIAARCHYISCLLFVTSHLSFCHCLNFMCPHAATVVQNWHRCSPSAKKPFHSSKVKPPFLASVSLCVKVGTAPFGSKCSSMLLSVLELLVRMLNCSDM